MGWTNNILYTLDATTGMATQVGSTLAGFGVGKIVPRDLATIGSALYMAGASTDALFALRYQ